ncbi:MAG: hypothetical protein IIA70_08510, partial [Proteobacteria bacterium]|nr:hypothetical protein [Pseudomonadota bacterium]
MISQFSEERIDKAVTAPDPAGFHRKVLSGASLLELPGGAGAEPGRGAIAADQALSLRQIGGEPPAFGLTIDDADLCQPAVERRRATDEIAEGPDAGGQGRGVGQKPERPPVGGRRLVVGRRQVLAQGYGKRRLVAGLDVKGVDQRRPPVIVAGV